MGKNKLVKRNTDNNLRQAKILFYDLECFKGDTEILTEEGFVRFYELKDQRVAQYHEDGLIDFVSPIKKIEKDYDGRFITFSKKRGSITTTENHQMVSKSVSSGKFKHWKAKDKPKSGLMMMSGRSAYIKKLTDLDRLAIALQADGYLKGIKKRVNGEVLGFWVVSLRKERKIERLKTILEGSGVRYTNYTYTRKTGEIDTIFNIYAPAKMTKKFSTWFKFYECGEDFIQELSLWDGSRKVYDSGYVKISYTSKDFDNISFAQNVATMNNRIATHCMNGSIYKLSFGKEKNMDLGKFSMSDHTDKCKVYCVEVPTHMIIVRHGQQVMVTGNCSPTLGYTYGQYQTNMIKVERPPVLLSFSWKWAGEKEVHCLTLHDRKTPEKNDDSWLVKELWKLLDEANIVVAHNTNFDIKMSNAFFLRHGLGLPSFYEQFCTLKTARRYFKLDNNRLDYIGQLLGVGRKTATTHHDVWYDCLINDSPKAWKKMADYNNQDVLLLERIYNKLLPFAGNHPNVALSAGKPDSCPRCGGYHGFKVKAYRRSGVQITGIQYQCDGCGGYVTRKLTKEERLELDYNGKLNTTFRNHA